MEVTGARYAYDTYANVTYQAFTWPNMSDTNTVFAYDDQNRVTAAYGQGFGWQPWGSLASLAGASYGYAAGHPHAVELLNGADRYDYDANGNMVVRSKGVSGQEHALRWDANNRLAQVVSSSGVTETYLYDEQGQRIRKQAVYSSTVGDSVTYVPFVFYEQAVSAGGSVVTRHYSVNGERVAVRVDGALSYLYHDQVGSTILATDAITNVVSSRGYYAFGATRRSSGLTPTDRRFTGQAEDGTGLYYYYYSRYYDPQLGQFLSPDTIVPEPADLLSCKPATLGDAAGPATVSAVVHAGIDFGPARRTAKILFTVIHTIGRPTAMARYLALTCEALARPVYAAAAVSPHTVNVRLFKQGLHNRPKGLRVTLQDEIDAVPQGEWDAILLAYGMCGTATVGLTSRHTPLVLPRAHDCITLYLGSRQRYNEEFMRHPGTYWYSVDYMERQEKGAAVALGAAGISDDEEQYEQYVQKYGQETADMLMEEIRSWSRHYTRATFIDLELNDGGIYAERAQEKAAKEGWVFERMQGDTRLMRMLMHGEWDPEEFLVVAPGQAIGQSYKDDIVKAVGA